MTFFPLEESVDEASLHLHRVHSRQRERLVNPHHGLRAGRGCSMRWSGFRRGRLRRAALARPLQDPTRASQSWRGRPRTLRGPRIFHIIPFAHHGAHVVQHHGVLGLHLHAPHLVHHLQRRRREAWGEAWASVDSERWSDRVVLVSPALQLACTPACDAASLLACFPSIAPCPTPHLSALPPLPSLPRTHFPPCPRPSRTPAT